VSDVDLIWSELAQIRRLLETTSEPTEKRDLMRRRDELREAARLAALDNDTTEQLIAELASLRGPWTDLQRMHIDVVQQSGGGAEHGIDNARDAMRINQEIDRSQGRSEIEDRISAIRRILEERNIDT